MANTPIKFIRGWAAYVEDDLIVKDRDFDEGRKGFIYVAGTGGNIQKGLDLLLETFAPHTRAAPLYLLRCGKRGAHVIPKGIIIAQHSLYLSL